MQGTADREDWKVKYRDLLNELENKQSDWRTLEDALRSVANRLAIAALGRDPQVDQRLDDIRTSIKARAGGDELLRLLDGLSGAVADHEKQLSETAAIDLSGFVADLGLSHADQRRFIDGFETGSLATRAQTLKDLGGELNRLLDASSAATGDAPRDPTPVVRSVLTRLTNHIREVPALAETIDEFEQRLRTGADIEDWDEPLSSLAAAITGMIESIEHEKNELEEFLEQVTQQLAQFEQWTRWHEAESQGREEESVEFGENVEQQVEGLQADMQVSHDLDDLKVRVQVRLDSIAEQLKEFREREKNRRNDADERNVALRNEIYKLKMRTSQLAQRCVDQESRLMFDTLTGVHTRYAYERRLQEEFQRWLRHSQPLVYTIWDIDLFKTVNDKYGHQTGDRLLKVIAGMLSKQTRTEDFVARIGGEEFVVLFPSTELDTAEMLANRLRESVAATAFQHGGSPLQITISCGLTEFRAGDTPQTVYKRADKALYEAKNSGRNKCVCL
ncbi:MAG: diguanylate cyclase [Gammaproteobacteria bacterium]|nr:diguanylate cyclase [Gammaproteobacteria bacterium]